MNKNKVIAFFILSMSFCWVTAQVSNIQIDTTICFGAEFQAPNGVVLQTDTVYSDTLLNKLGNDSVYLLVDLNVLEEIISYQSIQICETDSFLMPDSAYQNTTGVYSFFAVSSIGCDSTHIIDLQIVNNVTVSGILGKDTAFVGDTLPYLLQDYEEGNSVFVDLTGGIILSDPVPELLRIYWANQGAWNIEVNVFNGFCEAYLEKTVYVRQPLSLHHLKPNEELIQCYPNPTSNMLQLTLSNGGNVVLFDALGSVIRTYYDLEQMTTLDVTQLAAGCYYLKYGSQFVKWIKK